MPTKEPTPPPPGGSAWDQLNNAAEPIRLRKALRAILLCDDLAIAKQIAREQIERHGDALTKPPNSPPPPKRKGTYETDYR